MTEQQKQVGIYLVEAQELLKEITGRELLYHSMEVLGVAKMLQMEGIIGTFNQMACDISNLETIIRDRP